ncbi:reducing type I polyketide synthase, partial [Thozetella sp. PMI_491]
NSMEPIAIIGISFRFPGGAETPGDFWNMLVERKCAATEIPRDRFNIDAFWHPDGKAQNQIKTREGHFLKSDIKNFDGGFFSMAPHEIGSMDPQHRGLLETTYHAFENAGLRIEDVAGTRTSVHVGCFTTDFATMQFRDVQAIPKYNAIGTAGSMLANRISWFFDLRGESVYIDTACSSSLVALTLACQGLAAGGADMAVVGGSNIILIPEFSVSLSNMNFLSPTGRCHSFDAKADGYGRGEGLATLLLKPISKAIADRNPIRGVIRSAGTNQDGYTSSGIAQPSKDMQVQLIRDTYRKAGLDPKHTRFFEAHGTGTAVGDPIEARAIGEVFFKYRATEDPIYIGAVKSNLGHLEGASGLAGVVKAAMVLERGVIPPNANFEHLNPLIDADFFNLRFPTECIPWHKEDPIRRASVNSFGFGGSNAHVVLEAADSYFHSIGYHQAHYLSLSNLCRGVRPHDNNYTHTNGPNGYTNGHVNGWSHGVLKPKLLILSAADEDGTARQAEFLSKSIHTLDLQSIKEGTEVLEDVVFTLNMHRTMLEWKSYSVVGSLVDFAALKDSLSKPTRRISGTTPNLGLVFTGQGAQWPRMGIELLGWPVFTTSLMRSQKYLKLMGCEWYLVDELTAPGESSRVNLPEFSQAITTAVQIALVDLLASLAIRPSVVVGHSSGEIAAAYCAGFLCHESAIRVSYFRGRLSSKLALESATIWGMASVGLSTDQLPLELGELQSQHPDTFDASKIVISCINSPTNTTVSGLTAHLDLLVAHLSFKNVFARKLKVGVGYHSPQMRTVASDYTTYLSNLHPADTIRAKMVSTVIPGPVSVDKVCSGEYWAQNMVSPVRFVEAMDICCSNSVEEGDVIKLLDRSHSQRIMVHGWLEVGPHAALKGPIRDILSSHMRRDVHYASLLVRGRPADSTVLDAIGQLFCQGFEADLKLAARVDADTPREPRLITDLPQYPFNHSVTYWEESRRSKEFNSRVHRNHPLLGSQAMDWNPLDARWRFIIQKDAVPWATDHRVHGKMWYPAAGMVAMAVEATKQLLQDDQFDFELQNISFTGPIVVSEGTEGTETRISLVPASKTRGLREESYSFKISVRRTNNSWDEVCDGTISAQRDRQVHLDINGQDEEEHKQKLARLAYENAMDGCQGSIAADEMYRKIEENTGLCYGVTFRGLERIRYDKSGQAHARLIALDEAAAEASKPFTIHPATLDSIFQLAIPALSQGLIEAVPTLVPSRLTRLWISRDGVGYPSSSPQREFALVHSRAGFSSKRSAVASATAFSSSDMQIRVQVQELEVTEVDRDRDDTTLEQKGKAICHELVWKADPTLLGDEGMFQYCAQHRDTSSEPTEWFEGIRLMLLSFANEALEAMGVSNQKPLPSMERYMAWLQARLDAHRALSPTNSVHATNGSELYSGEDLQILAEHFQSTGYRGSIGVLVGRQLRQILVGETSAFQLLFDDPQYVANFYDELNATGKAFYMLRAYLDVLVHKDPSLRFLEIGAGTGATSSLVLDLIANPEQGARCAEYVFTDISEYFLSVAKEKFCQYDRVQYCILDIEQDLAASKQVVPGAYDIVVAANVLHATKDLSHTLMNVRNLLKPNGKLILMEMTTPHNVESGFVWGSLPGWWLGSEEFRQHSAVIDEDRWDHLFRQVDFSGVDMVFRDWDSDVCHGWSIMVSTAKTHEDEHVAFQPAGPSTALNLPNFTLVIDNLDSELQIETARSLIRVLQPQDNEATSELVTLEQVPYLAAHLSARNCILLADLDRAHLHDVDPSTFQAYQSLLTTFKSVLWLQMHEEQSGQPPYWAMAEGLCRVCRSENPLIRIVTLTLDAATRHTAESIVTQITNILRATGLGLDSRVFVSDEDEYMEISGHLCISRLRQARYLDSHIFTRTCNPILQRDFGSGAPVRLDIKTPGLLDTLEWVKDDAVYVPLGSDEVEVQVRAIGVNFKDGLVLLGRVHSSVLGSECAGYVTRVGKDVNGLQPGDRVAVGCLDTYKRLVRARERNVVKIPDSLSLDEAAGVPTAFCTAYHSLYKVARLQKGEKILIHAAAGGTGQAAVQIAQHIGAEIFATVGSTAKRDLLVSRYGMSEDHIFYSRDASFADGIRRMTEGRGVDVVLNSLSGKLLVASWEIIANFGRFVEIGRKDIDSREYLPMFPFKRNASFSGVDLVALVDGTGGPDAIRIMQDVFELMASGVLRPSYPIQRFPVDQAEQAFRLLASGKSTGKIVLSIEDDAVVPVREGEDSNYRFCINATYVVAGGLGGIGRQITRWLARRGATNILVLSRSAPQSSSEKARLVSELEAEGVNLQVGVCDIADLASVREAVSAAALIMPPIKGCFQSAMLIKDRTLAAMNHREWCEAIAPKVHGSWNLHAVLPSGMDFFVMLSSAVCIFGNSGQGNYSAGNTFQDALARHRVAQGEKAVAIDLGMVLGEGWLAERKHIHHRVMQFDQVIPLSQRELFSMLDYYCNPNTEFSSPAAAQVVTGLELPALILRAGRQVPDSMYRPLFRAMHQVIPGSDSSTAATTKVQEFSTMLGNASTITAAGTMVAVALKTKLCKILGLQEEDKSIHDRMDSFGVDSLVALEVRNWLAKELRADLEVYEILGDAKLIDTGMIAARKSEFRQAHWEHAKP